MATLSITVGALLILLGLGTYVGSGMESWTALIPAFLGLPFLLLGLLARNERYRKHAMHAAAVFALLGIGGTFRGLISLLTGNLAPDRPLATVAQSITAVLCIVFLIMAVRSFIAARRARA